ncbi:hypothetical protein AAF712_007410 [Marasmius tenuissimus]|uniref:Uncharacterized protein n=1 Tax=Marasmius tenuissimus TaxID=585030 RepID=A0ABR2ZX48_9AGAR
MGPNTAEKLATIKCNISKKYEAAVPLSSLLKKQTRNFKTTYVPISTAERLRRSIKRRERSTNIRNAIAELQREIRDKCITLGQTYKMKSRYFLDMVYQGGVRLMKPANDTNPFNAFKSVKAYDRREGTFISSLVLKVYRSEYDGLSKKEKTKIVKRYEEIRDENRREMIKRPSMKEMAADVSSSLAHVAAILQALKTQVGIDVLVLVVKNRSEDFMSPKWIVTDQRIMDYMRVLLRHWDPVYIGTQVEAFAVARCDIAFVCKTPREYAELLKKMITRQIQDALDEACTTKNATMQYERFHLITQRYGVIVEGWPANLPFQKPGSFHSDTNKLSQVYEAWKSGTAHFWKLESDELDIWRSSRAQGLSDGTVKVKECKKRKDAGTKKSKKGKGKEANAESGSEEDETTDEADENNGDGLDEPEPSTSAKNQKSGTTSKSTPSRDDDQHANVSKAAKAKARQRAKKPSQSKTAATKTPTIQPKPTNIPNHDDNLSHPASDVSPSTPPALPRPVPRRRTAPSVKSSTVAQKDGPSNDDHAVASGSTVESDNLAPCVPLGSTSVPDPPLSFASGTQTLPASPSSIQCPNSSIDPQLLPPEGPPQTPQAEDSTILPASGSSDPSIVPESDPTLGPAKRKRVSVAPDPPKADSVEEGTGRGKRKKIARTQTHLGWEGR